MYIPRTRKFWSVGLGHLINDTFGSSGVVILTFFSATIIPMSNTQLGLAVSLRQLMGAVSQPFFGLRADRTGGRLMGSGGLAWVISMYVLVLLTAYFTHNYYLMLIPYVIEGLGSGALHPVGALHAAESDDYRVASNTAYFFLMGQLGLALGPALVGFLLDAANSGAPGLPGVAGTVNPNILPLFLLTVFAVPVVGFMYRGLPGTRPQKLKSSAAESEHGAQRSLSTYLPFIVIAVMVLLRAMAQPGSVNFIPVLFEEKGWTPSQYGLITSSYWIASGIAGVTFGNLADRYDRRWIVMISMVLSAPAFFLLPVINGPMAFVLAIIGGGLSGGSHSIIVVLAQELIPHSKAFASGAALGFIFGSGALGSLAIGMISDQIGLPTTFQIVAFAAIISGLMGLLLPRPQRDAT